MGRTALARHLLFAAALAAPSACTEDEADPCAPPTGPAAPSDDAADWEVDTSVEYEPVLGEPRWVVPSEGLPEGIPALAANNNLSIAFFEDRLFLAYRTAETHFASENAAINVVSSRDEGASWDLETTIALGTDVREPLFTVAGGRLILSFFEAGTNWLAFEPRAMWRTTRVCRGEWEELETWGEAGEVPWESRVAGGRAYLTTYHGPHYAIGQPGEIDLRFWTSPDGLAWQALSGDDPTVYHGGASEAAFEFAPDGSLWAVLRNEDGDETGFGSLLCHAAAESLGEWSCPAESDPERYDSPRMLRHGDDLYLVARRDVGGPYDQGLDELTFEEQQRRYLNDYSTRPKRTALYRIDTEASRVVHVLDLPSAGDTAFPSVRRTSAHGFLVANYTSPVDDPDRTWLEGQLDRDGTAIYLVDLTFVPR